MRERNSNIAILSLLGRIPMMRFLVAAILVMGTALSPALASTGDNRPTLAQIEGKILALPETNELLVITESLLSRVAAADRDALAAAYAREDLGSMLSLMDLSHSEFLELDTKLIALGKSIAEQVPELERIKPALAGVNCLSASSVSDAIGTLTGNGNVVLVSCHWVLLVASLVLCTAAGPWLYWLCAYVASCTFCDGLAWCF